MDIRLYFDGSTQTGCGAATAQVGPFHCPVDREIVIDARGGRVNPETWTMARPPSARTPS